jgi:hypothetical protein
MTIFDAIEQLQRTRDGRRHSALVNVKAAAYLADRSKREGAPTCMAGLGGGLWHPAEGYERIC